MKQKIFFKNSKKAKDWSLFWSRYSKLKVIVSSILELRQK